MRRREIPPSTTQEGIEPPVSTTPAPVPTPPAPTATPTPPPEAPQFDQPAEGFQFRAWRPERPSNHPEGLSWDATTAGNIELSRFVEFWDSLNDNLSGLPPNPVEDIHELRASLAGDNPMPLDGRQEDVLDAGTGLFLTYKNLEEHLRQYGEFDPKGMEELERNVSPGVRFTAEAIARSGALTPWRALLRSLEVIEKEHPDNYTQYLASDAGRIDLFSNALMAMYSTPRASMSILHPGQDAGHLIDEYMPDVPFLKQSLISTVELIGDPLFIGATVLFPPAGIAAKAALGTKVAVGMAVGEEAAEAVGVPPIVGALAGGVAGPGVIGFGRATLRNAVAKSRWRPVAGEPATEMLISAGELSSGRGTVMFHGTTPENARRIVSGGFRQGDELFLTSEPDLAGRFGGRHLQRNLLVDKAGKTPKSTVLAIEVPEGVEMGGREAIRTIKGADAGKVRILGELSAEEAALTGEKFLARMNPYSRNAANLGYKPIAGGAGGPSPDDFALKIKVHLERPESQDFLRKAAKMVSERVPGVGRRTQEIINRMAVADDPALKAAFGWQFQLAEDQAARFMSMAALRGKALPFVENEIGQIWVRTGTELKSKTTGRVFGNLFRRGEGEWIAGGDVLESVMAGKSKYLKRLTDEQVSWIKEAEEILRPYISYAEKAAKLTLRKRETWWPRFAVDPARKAYNVRPGAGRGKPPALFARVFEEQQQAIAEFGIKYRPGLLNQLEGGIEGFQKITRDNLMGGYLKKQGIIRMGQRRLGETYATDLGTTIKGIVGETHAQEILNIIGPGTRNPVITIPGHINDMMRMMLTGSMDAGWGSIQLVTLAASPAGPVGWGKAMGLAFFTAMKDPKFFHRYMRSSAAARQYAQYGGDVSLRTEITRAAEEGAFGLPRVPVVSTAIDVATFVPRKGIERLTIGFGSALAYGRVLAFEGMAQSVAKPGLMELAVGAKPLAGQALHEEMFRLVRFTESLLGTPRLGGVITALQHQIESAFVWFATRYTRSFFGTGAYMIGKGATPAQARATMARMVIGGMSIMSGLITAKGIANGLSEDSILKEISTALNPAAGKKFMSMEIGGSWYGLGGTYRSQMALIAGMANKDNWDFENWEESLYDNPIVRGWRGRAAPFTGQVMNFGPSLAGLLTGNSDVSGSDYLGYEVNISEMVDDPRVLGDYALDNFAPITLDALLQGHEWDWKTNLPRFAAEFMGLRTSPETAFEALEPVMNRVSQDRFAMNYRDLENNLPAQDYIRNHPDVVAVTEGQIRPIREREQSKLWRKYREGRDGIRDTHLQTRERAEIAYTTSRIDGSDYREQYGEAQSAEYFELRGFSEGMGIEFDDEEAEAGTVNAALDAYFSVNLDDYRDKKTRVPDWEAFYSDRDAALALVPREHIPLVEQWLRRRETEVRRHMRVRFGEVVESSGYFRVRENVAVNLGINLSDLESDIVRGLVGRNQRATPGDVARIVDQILNSVFSEVNPNAPTISQLRQAMREANPELDAELFRQGFSTTVRSEVAQETLKAYAQRWPNMGYFEAPLAGNIDD
ncbi:hypothetical protein LCGC14_0289290 [marine sediment metagenome]|uniref:Large polyvalent protein associated domain-containing protein n=1 Tax=marine sediment metagenome TaxID=412755 RepID=A0A0F9UAS6_9ZZZZ